MGTRSRMREDPEYYEMRKTMKALSRMQPRGAVSTTTEFDMLYQKLRFDTIEDTEEYTVKVDGVNKYCVYCKKGSSKRIMACRHSACANHTDRYSTKKEEKKKEEVTTAP